MLATPTVQLRKELGAPKGIGPETADSILLYAGHRPSFVLAAYTRRVLERYDAIHPKATYDMTKFEALSKTRCQPLNLA
jgi:endonuclease-3 related protein